MKATKFLVALAAAAALVGFAACSDEEQDVNIVSSASDREQDYTISYTATGTVQTKTVTDTILADGTTDSTTTKTVTHTPLTAKTNPATISWRDNTLKNKTEYSVYIPKTSKSTTVNAGTPTVEKSYLRDTLFKYGSKYYTSYSNSGYLADGTTRSSIATPVEAMVSGINAYASEVKVQYSYTQTSYKVGSNIYVEKPSATALSTTGETTYTKITETKTVNLTLTKITN